MPPFLIESLQRLGRALMLPIAILPIAGLLLRLGDVDLLDIPLVHDAGKAIFANLALIFAIGIAVGFARDNNGTAGLAGAIGYLVMISVLKVIDPGIDMGVLSGIISGLVAGALYNRFKDVKLPEYLGCTTSSTTWCGSSSAASPTRKPGASSPATWRVISPATRRAASSWPGCSR